MFRPALIAVALCVALPACQIASTQYSKSGIYAGASLVGAASNFDVEDLDSTETSAGVGIRGGYRFLDRFAVELAYEGGEKFSGHDIDIRIDTLAVQGKFYPLTGTFQPYGLIGVGSLWGDANRGGDDGTGGFGRIGAGLEMYFLSMLPAFVEFNYNAPGGDASDLDYYSGQIGLLIRF